MSEKLRRLPEIPFWAGIALWTACAVAFTVAGTATVWSWAAWVPVGVILVMASGRSAAIRSHERQCQRAAARAAIDANYEVKPVPTTTELERLVKTGELDGLYQELDTAAELKVAAGSMTGTPPSEIWRFMVLVIDREGHSAVATSCSRGEIDYMLHRAHRELVSANGGSYDA